MKTAATWACRVILLMSLVSLAAAGPANAQETIRLASSSNARDLYLQAENLLAGGHARNAYELLRSYEPDLVGNPYFDYLLGVAALDTGRTGEAILSLQRAAAAAPEFAGARMELARAHFEAREYDAARAIFVDLLAENPPDGIRQLIDSYIGAIDSRLTSPPHRFAPYAELLAGYDSNANGSTDDQQFMGFTLSPENQATDSAFIEAAAGFDWNLPRSATFGWFLGARASYRDNPDAAFVDAGLVSGLASANWRSGAFFGKLGVNAYGATRDGKSNETYGGAEILLGRNIGDRWDVSAGLRSGALRYDESIEVLDVNRTLYSLGTSFQFAPRGRIAFEFVGGDDNAQQTGSPYGNSKVGGRIALRTAIGESSFFQATAGSLTSDYDGLFFGSRRKDRQDSVLLQLEINDVWTTGLTLAPRLRYIDNDSDIALYSYDRTEFGLLIRWAPQ